MYLLLTLVNDEIEALNGFYIYLKFNDIILDVKRFEFGIFFNFGGFFII